MEKPAPVDHPIHALLHRRWSPRAFADRPVPRRDLLSVLEAARWAPSSFNEQPWRFIVARRHDEPEVFDRISECLSGNNKKWAPRAPVLMVACASTHFDRNGKPNRHARHDVGQALAHMTVQAMARNLWVHQMAGFDAECVREAFEIPEEFEPVTAVAIGYGGNPDDLPEPLDERDRRDRSRRPLEDTVWSGRWADSTPIVEPGKVPA